MATMTTGLVVGKAKIISRFEVYSLSPEHLKKQMTSIILHHGVSGVKVRISGRDLRPREQETVCAGVGNAPPKLYKLYTVGTLSVEFDHAYHADLNLWDVNRSTLDTFAKVGKAWSDALPYADGFNFDRYSVQVSPKE